ncbi:S24 family peptidase [uncultured Alistipes sp.]|uniref:S24 family peptidase n=1 Tax=uncultured Alistipes sp. TaxID=538949 RepID=UPI00272C48DE|nr:S24 family peptidase [uncultured Alistipes sp.]
MSDKERIKQYLEYKGISKNKFYSQTGLSIGFLDSGSSLGVDKARIIINKFPDISLNWLIMGIGDMLRSDTDTQIATAEPTTIGGIPLIPIEAMAGVLSGNSAQVMERDCEHYNIPMFKGAEFLIRISGDSMQPKYYSGDIVACKRLPLDTFFQWNRVYVVDSEQGVIIKRVRRGSDDRHIIFVSDNTAYEPFELPLEKIYSIALVVGVVRAE